jgi:hypothetical protein
MEQGQDVAGTLDYARLPAAVIKVNEGTLGKLTIGGKPLLANR